MQKDRLHTMVATGFYVGKIPFMPGTFGSLLAVLIWVITNYFFFALCQNFNGESFFLYSILAFWAIVIIATFFIGIKSSEYYCKKHHKDDASEVVIDEFCGQWITLFISCLASGAFGLAMTKPNIDYLITILLSLILFRIFDIFKPWIINKIDKNVKGGLGVMLDDVLAGMFAGLVFVVFQFIFLNKFLNFIKI
jgi:phosphatidylglycerophosphatase A